MRPRLLLGGSSRDHQQQRLPPPTSPDRGWSSPSSSPSRSSVNVHVNNDHHVFRGAEMIREQIRQRFAHHQERRMLFSEENDALQDPTSVEPAQHPHAFGNSSNAYDDLDDLMSMMRHGGGKHHDNHHHPDIMPSISACSSTDEFSDPWAAAASSKENAGQSPVAAPLSVTAHVNRSIDSGSKLQLYHSTEMEASDDSDADRYPDPDLDDYTSGGDGDNSTSCNTSSSDLLFGERVVASVCSFDSRGEAAVMAATATAAPQWADHKNSRLLLSGGLYGDDSNLMDNASIDEDDFCPPTPRRLAPFELDEELSQGHAKVEAASPDYQPSDRHKPSSLGIKRMSMIDDDDDDDDDIQEVAQEMYLGRDNKLRFQPATVHSMNMDASNASMMDRELLEATEAAQDLFAFVRSSSNSVSTGNSRSQEHDDEDDDDDDDDDGGGTGAAGGYLPSLLQKESGSSLPNAPKAMDIDSENGAPSCTGSEPTVRRVVTPPKARTTDEASTQRTEFTVLCPLSKTYQQLCRDPAYQHAQAAGILWQTLVGQHLRFPKIWFNGSRVPPMGAELPSTWKYYEPIMVPQHRILHKAVRNRAQPGCLLLHLIVQDMKTCRPMLDVVVGCFHPNARGVRHTNRPVPRDELYRCVWLAVRRRDLHTSSIVERILQAPGTGVTEKGPLGTARKMTNDTLRPIFGERPPLETLMVPEGELYERVSAELAVEHAPSPVMVLLNEFLFA